MPKNTANQTPLSQGQIELKASMRRDAASMLYANSYSGIAISFITSVMLVFGLHSGSSSELGKIWWLVMAGTLLFRATDTLLRDSGHQDYRQRALDAGVKRYSTGVVFTAALWGLYALVAVRHSQDGYELASTLIVISSLAGGATTVLSSHMKLALAYVTLLMVPVCISLLTLPEKNSQALGILGMCFWFVMFLISIKSGKYTAESIRLKNVNASLVNHMEKEVNRRTETIYELSNLDPLTGLFNRSAFSGRLEVALNLANITDESVALLFIDLDGFKKVNDACGHEVGDKILSQTAARLKKICRPDELFCRWGGDEFLIAISNVSASAAQQRAKAVIDHISESYYSEDNRLSVSATIGISMFPQHGNSVKELISMADTAMYFQKKKAPSKAAMFSEPLGERIVREANIKNGLSSAIANGELRTVFQPLICSKSGEVMAFEALLRWELDGEKIPPQEFIAIAEQFGMIRKIGAWVINDACRVAGGWDPDQRISVSVNVSVMQLQDEDFIDIISLALINNRLEPELLHIELTESVFALDKVLIAKQIGALQELGIKVSIDDFGTGYSSLSALQELSVDMVKIDRSFVSNMDESGFSIVTAVMQIARALNYRVVAEGVETSAQAKRLNQAGVEYQQGYYFSKPMEEHQISGYMQSMPHMLTKLSVAR